MKLEPNLTTCSALSALLHGLVLLPALANWLDPLVAVRTSWVRPPVMQVHLSPPRPPRLAGPVVRSGQPGQIVRAGPRPQPRQERPQPMATSRSEPVVRPALPAPMPRALPTAYPQARPLGARPPRVQRAVPLNEGAGEGGLIILDPPVLIKGPQQIPVPPFLRNRDGHFLLTLRCQIAVDGSSRVVVMEGTGAPDLDESVRESFSGLPWYRGEKNGQPIELTVRLVIEGTWKFGDDSILWGGRVPHSQTEAPTS